MEKPNKPKNNLFLKYLPKAASAVSFQNPMFSPGRDKRSSTKHGLGFSGPLIPEEARRRPKNGSTSSFPQEPTSPKVSCIGQIKLKHKQKKKMMMMKMKSQPSVSSSDQHHHHKAKESKKQSLKFQKIFGKSKSGVFDGKSNGCGVMVGEEEPPSLGMMKKFASGRETLSNFDWTAEIKVVDYDDCDNYHSDHEERRRRGGNYGGAEEVDYDEKEVIIPHSAPILTGKGRMALEQSKRKDVNLWMRRSLASPSPLQIKSRVASQ